MVLLVNKLYGIYPAIDIIRTFHKLILTPTENSAQIQRKKEKLTFERGQT